MKVLPAVSSRAVQGLALAASCIAALSLAACSKPAGNAAPGQATASGDAVSATAPSSASASASSSSAPAGDDQGAVIDMSQMPTPRAGEWQTTDTVAGHPPDVTKSCVSGKTPTIRAPKDCQTFTIRKTLLGHIVFDATCHFQGGVGMTMHSEIQGDLVSHYSGDVSTTMVMGPGKPPVTELRHTEASYIGPCAPGETPDD